MTDQIIRLDINNDKYIRFTILVITLFTAIFFGLPIISGEYFRAWDAPLHLFFASGYVNDWWATWDQRWYGGYSKFFYPPLSHQIVAILTMLTGNLKLSYEIVIWVFVTAGPFAVYWFSRSFVDKPSSLIASTIFVFMPSIRTMILIFGQFAGFISLIFLLLTVGTVSKFIDTGKKAYGFLAICLAACVGASHHNTTIFILPIALFLATAVRINRYDIKIVVLRSLTIWISSTLALIVVIFPFWNQLLSIEMQTPIQHFSRESILNNKDITQTILIDIYGIILPFVPFAIAYSVKKRNTAILMFAFVLYSILGLGGTTNLPSILYGKWWQWLTFERFGIWSTILLIPLLGELIAKIRSKFLFDIFLLLLSLLVFLSFDWIVDPNPRRSTPIPVDLQPVLEDLNKLPLCRERYLALGFGYQLPDFATYTNAMTLDGLWYTARSDALLRSSGIGSLGDALDWNNGEATLRHFLDRNNPIPAYCIFINHTSLMSQKYQSIISDYGWSLQKIYYDEVSLWINNNSLKDREKDIELPLKNRQIYGYLWGILPLSTFLLTIIAGITCLLNDRQLI